MSSSQGLHPTAESMYRFIVRFKRMNAGDSPSRREIAAALGLPSVSMVQHHLVALERHGLITRAGTRDARRIGIPGAVWTPPPQLERKGGGKVGERWGGLEGIGK